MCPAIFTYNSFAIQVLSVIAGLPDFFFNAFGFLFFLSPDSITAWELWLSPPLTEGIQAAQEDLRQHVAPDLRKNTCTLRGTRGLKTMAPVLRSIG